MSRRQVVYVLLGLLALAVWGSLLGGWMSSPDRSSAGKSAETVAVEKTSKTPTSYAGRVETELPPRLAAALNDADPRVRIRALETWAQQPGEDLNPVTYALVDPDESVRARAQELLEGVLARR